MSISIDLHGRRVLVIGGSSGIGRAAALAAATAGATIAVVGRSDEKLEEVVTTAGTGVGIAADVSDAGECERVVSQAVDAMGGLDALLFTTAISPLAPLEEVDAATWQQVITTNAIAPALVTQAALPHISDDGVMVFVSSTAVRNANFGLGPYAVSKAALDRLVRAWRTEQPDTRYVCMVVGETEGTAFARDFDMERAASLLPNWVSSSSVYRNSMQAADLGTAIAEFVAMLLAHPGLTVPEIMVVPPGPMMTMEDMQMVMDGLAQVLESQ